MSSLISRINLGFSSLLLNLDISDPNSYILIKFEEMVSDPSIPLKVICDKLSLSFSDIMVRPTAADKAILGIAMRASFLLMFRPKMLAAFMSDYLKKRLQWLRPFVVR